MEDGSHKTSTDFLTFAAYSAFLNVGMMMGKAIEIPRSIVIEVVAHVQIGQIYVDFSLT